MTLSRWVTIEVHPEPCIFCDWWSVLQYVPKLTTWVTCNTAYKAAALMSRVIKQWVSAMTAVHVGLMLLRYDLTLERLPGSSLCGWQPGAIGSIPYVADQWQLFV